MSVLHLHAGPFVLMTHMTMMTVGMAKGIVVNHLFQQSSFQIAARRGSHASLILVIVTPNAVIFSRAVGIGSVMPTS